VEILLAHISIPEFIAAYQPGDDWCRLSNSVSV